MVIGKASATITLTAADLNQTYSGTAKTVGYSISPVGVIGVSISYKQGATVVASPTNAGSSAVTAILINDNYKLATANDPTTGTLVIGKAASTTTVTIAGGPYTYTGSAQTPATVSVS